MLGGYTYMPLKDGYVLAHSDTTTILTEQLINELYNLNSNTLMNTLWVSRLYSLLS